MTDYLTQAVTLLHSDDQLTCAVCGPNGTLTAQDRGIKPILHWLGQAPAQLSGGCVADKVVGKAAALLFIQGGIAGLYTRIISQPALDALNAHHIPTTYDQLVPRIVNRTGDGLCPMESRVITVDDPAEAYLALKDYKPF